MQNIIVDSYRQSQEASAQEEYTCKLLAFGITVLPTYLQFHLLRLVRMLSRTGPVSHVLGESNILFSTHENEMVRCRWLKHKFSVEELGAFLLLNTYGNDIDLSQMIKYLQWKGRSGVAKCSKRVDGKMVIVFRLS